MPASPATVVDGTPVYGVDVDSETRCAHYDSERDVIAIRFACCGDYYPCLECHDELTDHTQDVWAADEFDERGVLCGVCGTELRIREYLDADSSCSTCDAAFNPGCRTHWPAYFDIDR